MLGGADNLNGELLSYIIGANTYLSCFPLSRISALPGRPVAYWEQIHSIFSGAMGWFWCLSLYNILCITDYFSREKEYSALVTVNYSFHVYLRLPGCGFLLFTCISMKFEYHGGKWISLKIDFCCILLK